MMQRAVMVCVFQILLVGLVGCDDEPLDPCDGVECSGHGVCEVVSHSPQCNCFSGYVTQGLSCRAESDGDADGDVDADGDADGDGDGDADADSDGDLDADVDDESIECVEEVCNRLDDDCDGEIDEDCIDPEETQARFPWNGYTTGSVHASSSLRPTFHWEEVPDAADYEIEVDDSCSTPGFAACDFPSPEVTEVVAGTTFSPEEELEVPLSQPVGRRYYWRVRSCRGTACSAWTRVRYLDVGRMSQDFNGDGYADVVVGAPFQHNGATSEGNAFVFHGTSAGISMTPTTSLDNPDNQVYGLFGGSVASAGDIDGDGFSDLVIGAGYQTFPEGNEGNIFIYHGSDGGISTEPTLRIDNPDDLAGGHFGEFVNSAGDVDGDGYADIIVGAPTFDNSEAAEGNVFIFYGSVGGVTPSSYTQIDNPDDQEESSFGSSVASAGDVNGDGYVDYIVGAPAHDNSEENEGNAFLFHGSPSGASAIFDTRLDNPDNQMGSYFAKSVASAGDVNSDGFADIVVGAFRQEHGAAEEGNVFVFVGSVDGLEELYAVRLDNPDNQEGGLFGSSVSSAGDVNADGYDDVLVGAYAQDSGSLDEGNAFLYLGSADGVRGVYDIRMDNPDNEEGAHFGRSVSSADDIDGDGFIDIIVGASSQTNGAENEGNAFVFSGSSDGVETIDPTRLDNPANQSGGTFGRSVD